MKSIKIFLTILMALVLMGLTWVSAAAASDSVGSLDSSEGEIARMDAFELVGTEDLGIAGLALTETPTLTPTVTLTPTLTPTPTVTPTVTLTPTLTPTPVVTPTVTPTPTLTPTPTVTPTVTPEPDEFHPVGLALASFFDVAYDGIMEWHEDGVGFGNIAKAYFVVDELEDEGVTVEDVLGEKLSGTGWGRVMKALGLGPSSKDKNLGKAMSGYGNDDEPDDVASPDETDGHPGKGHGPPEKDKKDKGKARKKG